MLRVFVRISGVVGLTALVLLATITGLVRRADSARLEELGSAATSIGWMNAPADVSNAIDVTITLSPIAAGGLTRPVGLAHAPDGSGRLFVVEQPGSIRIIKRGVLLSAPYLTLTNRVVCCGERGLLGLEFDRDFETNGTFYVNYTTSASGFSGDTVIARYQIAAPAADTATVLTVTHIITIDQPDGQTNHKGGDLHFGSDGYLYIGTGDGGGANDEGVGHAPEGNGQSPGTLLGKMLRINVRSVPTYTVPANNPFTQTAGYRPEIWSLGWRNPWRFSFDRATGDMYAGDVGQNCWEEVSYEPAGSSGGRNYGWRLEEGLRQFDPSDAYNCDMPVSTLITLTRPITAYGRSLGSTVTGGYVYRGARYPGLRGLYFYADYGSGRVWAIQQIGPGAWAGAEKLNSPYSLSAFGEDEAGELYVTSYGNPAVPGSGGVYQITSLTQTLFLPIVRR